MNENPQTNPLRKEQTFHRAVGSPLSSKLNRVESQNYHKLQVKEENKLYPTAITITKIVIAEKEMEVKVGQDLTKLRFQIQPRQTRQASNSNVILNQAQINEKLKDLPREEVKIILQSTRETSSMTTVEENNIQPENQRSKARFEFISYPSLDINIKLSAEKLLKIYFWTQFILGKVMIAQILYGSFQLSLFDHSKWIKLLVLTLVITCITTLLSGTIFNSISLFFLSNSKLIGVSKRLTQSQTKLMKRAIKFGHFTNCYFCSIFALLTILATLQGCKVLISGLWNDTGILLEKSLRPSLQNFVQCMGALVLFFLFNHQFGLKKYIIIALNELKN